MARFQPIFFSLSQLHTTLKIPNVWLRFKVSEMPGLDTAQLEANVAATESFYTYDSVSKKFLCMECGMQAESKENTTIHVLRHHMGDDERAVAVACPLCQDYKAKHPKEMKIHVHVSVYDVVHCAGRWQQGSGFALPAGAK